MNSTAGVKKLAAFALVGVASVMTAACSSLPTSGPTAAGIRHSAAKTQDPRGLRIVDIDPAVASESATTTTVVAPTLVSLARNAPVDRIGPGDVLSVQIFEVGAGLFTGGRTTLGDVDAPPSASGETLGGGLEVAEDGSITVPYVGRLMVAGKTAAQVQDQIVAGLRGKSQSPQVLVTTKRNITNTIYVIGAVNRPGRQPVTAAHEHLLDALAEAGGPAAVTSTGNSTATGTGPQDFLVQLTRDGRTVEQRLDEIQPGAPDDLGLVPGDRINVLRVPRTFLVLGATDHIAQIPFESRALSLAEALARIGGPSDARADPRSIYVFRDVSGLQPKPAGGDYRPAAGQQSAATPIPTIYRLDMMKADGLFLAQRFAVRDKDLIYISNAPVNQPEKLVQIIGTLFSPFFAINAAVR